MAVASNKQQARRKNSRRNRNGTIISAYHVGDVRTDEAVFITSEAAVAGDIFAPEVVVEGVLYGFIVSQVVTVEAGGQVWGDVYTAALQIQPEGKVQGWVSTINERAYVSLKADQVRYEDFQNGLPEVIHAELKSAVEGVSAAMPPNRINILRLLQAEAAAALVARAELERSFEDRLTELAGESLSESSRLKERMAEMMGETTGLQQRIVELNAALRQLERDQNQKNFEMKALQAEAAEAREASERLEATLDTQSQELLKLLERANQLERDYNATAAEAENAAERIVNLEAALQRSFQDLADREEALERWQELVEASTAKADGVTADVQSLTERLQARETQLAELREKHQTTMMELGEVRSLSDQLKKKVYELEVELAQKPDNADRVSALEQELENKKRDLKLAKETLVDTTGALTEAKRQIDKLELALTAVQGKAKAYDEAQAEIEALQAELIDAQRRTDALDRMQADTEEALRLAEERLAELERKGAERGEAEPMLAKKLAAAQATIAAQNEQIMALSQQQPSGGTAEIDNLQRALQESKMQLEAYEADLVVYENSVAEQGKRLAEVQAALAEREHYLSRVLDAARKQAVELKRVKEAAAKRIQMLESQLAAGRQQK